MPRAAGSYMGVAIINGSIGVAVLVLFGLPFVASLLLGLLSGLATYWFGVLAKRAETFAESLQEGRRQPPTAQTD